VILYHFTQLECVLGKAGLAAVSARMAGAEEGTTMSPDDAAPGRHLAFWPETQPRR
jgi:hypothetical protein